MRVLVTGARGKVGRATVAALMGTGHEVVATDLGLPTFEREGPGEPAYVQARLDEAGDAYAVVRGAEAVVHAAAIPDPHHSPPHTVFRNNLMATFNTLEAAVRWGCRASSTSRARRCPASSSPSGRSRRTTCRSTRRTRTGRRTRTRWRSCSASS